MSKHIIKSVLFLILVIIFAGCKKKDTVGPDPGQAALSFPAQNSACTTGTVLNSTQSSIVFTWGAAFYANSYELDIKNLLTNVITTQTATTNQLAVTLLRNTPYSWFVISKSDYTGVTTKSDVWKFYNAGIGTVSHPPFPADVVAPTFGQSVTAVAGSVNLSWLGSSIDNNITGYDVYFGTSATPPLIQSNVTGMSMNGVAVISGTTYYWKIVTKDALGNTSDSAVFQFKVN